MPKAGSMRVFSWPSDCAAEMIVAVPLESVPAVGVGRTFVRVAEVEVFRFNVDVMTCTVTKRVVAAGSRSVAPSEITLEGVASVSCAAVLRRRPSTKGARDSSRIIGAQCAAHTA